MRQLNRLSSLLLLVSCTGCLILSSCNQPTTTAPPSASSSAEVSPAANSQPSPPNPMQLFESEQFKSELKLTEEQVSQIKKIKSEFEPRITKEIEAIQKLPEDKQKDEIAKKIEPLNQEIGLKVDKIFNPEQAKRAKEIVLQVYGVGILSKNDFMPELKLTEAQKKQLGTISDQVLAKLKATMEIPSGDAVKQAKIMADNTKRTEAIRKESHQQVSAVLTPEQQKKLETLKGKPFSYTPSAVYPK